MWLSVCVRIPGRTGWPQPLSGQTLEKKNVVCMYSGILLQIKCTQWERDEVAATTGRSVWLSQRWEQRAWGTEVRAVWSTGRKHKSSQDQAVLPGVRVWPLRGHWGQGGNMQGLLGALGMLSVLIQKLVTWVSLVAADLFRFSNPVWIWFGKLFF